MENDDDNILMLFFIYIYIYLFIYLFILLYNWKEKGLFSYDSIAKMLENIWKKVSYNRTIMRCICKVNVTVFFLLP